MYRRRSQTGTDPVLFECGGFPLGDARRFAAIPKVSCQRVRDLVPNDLGRWLYVFSPKNVAIEKSAKRADLSIPRGNQPRRDQLFV